uniref:Uncharacterized protein n=1 Tax=Rhizobium rhizogenes TaxID=359 RepID=A0A7S4ZS75_RHIRH|nr:hypothetical protein pC5.8d_782 [Rhizobium rhizogenes]
MPEHCYDIKNARGFQMAIGSQIDVLSLFERFISPRLPLH